MEMAAKIVMRRVDALVPYARNAALREKGMVARKC